MKISNFFSSKQFKEGVLSIVSFILLYIVVMVLLAIFIKVTFWTITNLLIPALFISILFVFFRNEAKRFGTNRTIIGILVILILLKCISKVYGFETPYIDAIVHATTRLLETVIKVAIPWIETLH